MRKPAAAPLATFQMTWFWVTWWLVAAIGVLSVAALVILPSPWPSLVLAGVTAAVAMARRVEVKVSPTGVLIRGYVSTRFVPWSDVSFFGADKRCGYIVAAGERIDLPAVHLYALDAKVAYLRSLQLRYGSPPHPPS